MAAMDWVAKLLQLPEEFYNSHPGPGAGMIQVKLKTLKFSYNIF